MCISFRWRPLLRLKTTAALLASVFIGNGHARAALPVGWGSVDVGSPALAGSATYSNGVWAVVGGGWDIWDTGDQFRFVTNSLNGDGAVIARVIGQTGRTEGWAQSGIMIRSDLSSNAPQVSLMLTPSNGVSFRYRYTAGGATYQVNQTGVTAPEFIRLSRSNSTFVASYSDGGTSWSQLGSPQTVSMPNQVLAGLAVTAHNNSLLNTGTFTGLLIVPGAQAGTQTNLINPMIGGLEMAWQTTWPLPQLDVASNAPTPRMGWNSYFVVGVNNPGPMESIIRETADALVTNGLAAVGYRYEVIDGSWIATGRGYRDSATGDLMVTNTFWPSGMKAVADYVHSKGLFMGGYSDIGSLGYGGSAPHIGMYAYHQHDADQFASWGWDFIKIDDHGPGDFYAACHAITHNSSGRPIVLSLSTPQVDGVRFATRIANSYRVANDISFTMGTVTWSAILAQFEAAQARWFAQAPGHWNDPDMLCTGLSGITDVEGRSAFNMWCILGAPLMIGTDVRMNGTKYYAPLLTAATLNTLTNNEVIAVDQDPLGAVGRPVAGSTAIYAKPLGSFASGHYAVLLLNHSSQSNSFTINWSDLGLVAGSAATVRDLWTHQNLGAFTNRYASPVRAPHDSMMLVVTGNFDWARPRTYEAESGYNTLGGTAYFVPNNSAFSSGTYVTGVGAGSANSLQFNKIAAPSNGLYQVAIHYASGTSRQAQLTVNSGAPTTVIFPGTDSDMQPAVLAVYVPLNAGENTLAFSTATAAAPNFDKIVVSLGTPRELNATAGDGEVTLAWQSDANAATFNVYRSTTSGGQDSTPLVMDLTAATYTDMGLTNGQSYYYTVTAVVPALGGESPPSNEANAKPRYVTSSTAYRSAVLAANPVAYWRLNESSGATAYDYVGGFNGSYGSAVVQGIAGPRPPDLLGFETTNVTSRFSRNVADSWITIPALNLNTNRVAITAWIYPVGTQAGAAGVVFCRNGGTTSGLNFGDGSNSGKLGYTWNDMAGSWGWNSDLTPPADQWSLVALVVEPTRAILYLFNTNGQQTATNTLSHPVESFDASGTIGTDTYSSAARAFNGMIDEVAVFDRSLSAAELQQFHAAGYCLARVELGLWSADASLELYWPQGTLFQASDVIGPWWRVTNESPFLVTPTNLSTFYRVLLRQE